MVPFIHIGHVAFATYGIMMATGMFVGYYMLRADLRRREIDLKPITLIIAICGSGFVASKLYLGIESPRLFLDHPSNFLNPSGYTFYGAVIGAIVVICMLAGHYKVPALSLFDAVSPEAALGYGFGRVGCFLAGDGDYGVATSLPWGMSFPHGLVPTLQRVHPTPIYEVIGAAIITAYLWRMGRPEIRRTLAPGTVFAHYLIWTGLARFMVEFIRLNPRVYAGFTNAQLVAIVSVFGGIALITAVHMHGRTQELSSDLHPQESPGR
jgi:phosphatidylglycerol---prolipoprotein diacylglyceryl transferase